ncbi:cellulose biosynthesis protein BcsQ [Zavarzinia sp.]|uniref:cellulose biosynthesis protein BcsQ n=1 Tax=Zavarzinia sp. TaxID=2027920 RepID=UPI003BB806CB|nr:cellulose biosynthesis protein BcsQ [Zavarzinia sp.]
MPVLAFSSPKGGVGKTTLTANVAVALHQLGWGVLVIDFDVQNSLRLHFGMALDDERGYVAFADEPEEWPNLAMPTNSGVFFLPYGQVTEEQRLRFERHLTDEPDYLMRGLGSILERPDWVVLADLPPGPVPALRGLDRIGATHVAVLLADATSLSLLPLIERGHFYGARRPLVVLNQVDPRRQLSRSVTDFVSGRIPDHLIGEIYRDEAVAEAIGWQRSVFEQAPASVGARDIKHLAEVLSSRLKQEARNSAPLPPAIEAHR